MASAEIAPFAKVGGLADVVGSLPPALKKLDCDVRLILPLYGTIDKKKYKIKKIKNKIEICSGGKIRSINIWQSKLPSSHVPVYFIEEENYFSPKEVYANKNNSERYMFFSLAVLHVLPHIGFQPDVIHAHDFHTALISDLLKAGRHEYFKNTKTLYTIHNLNYQGKTEIEILKTGNLSKDSLKSLSKDAQDGDINFMVQGIINADLVNTVSPTYAKEIATSFYGAGLEKVIRNNKRKFSGILNGIDIDLFNPTVDKMIRKKYSTKSLNKKIKNKLYLQKKLDLKKEKNIPIVSLVSRLVWQKGFELITKDLIDLNCQFVFLGTGQKKYENYIKKLAKKYPDKVSANIMFDIKLAQEIYAGSDIFLMPSRFEPCGLGQMIAMRYGTVPVVRKTGGLADTVGNFQLSRNKLQINSKLQISKSKTGFVFEKFEAKSLENALKNALKVYYDYPEVWRQLQINGMKQDFSWNKSAKEYLKLYKKLAK